MTAAKQPPELPGEEEIAAIEAAAWLATETSADITPLPFDHWHWRTFSDSCLRQHARRFVLRLCAALRASRALASDALARLSFANEEAALAGRQLARLEADALIAETTLERALTAGEAARARAETAEKVAAAERALRLAERATWEAIANGGLGEQQSAGMDEAAAYRALCALGVEP